LRRQERRERTPFRRFDSNGVSSERFGVVAHPVEEHGFADAAQADHDDALRRRCAPDALDGDADRFAQLIAPRQLRRRSSCPGGERVGYGIHGAIL
jgi:hypothetical protein